MRILILAVLIMIGGTASQAFTGDSHFEIRADGLACPYCAYGVEKKLMKINGVKRVDIKLKEGLVFVTGEKGLKLGEKQMEKLFKDAGFTFRALVQKPVTKDLLQDVSDKN